MNDYAQKPGATDGIVFVTTEGLDTNDGLSWGSAKASIAGALAALQESRRGTIEIGAGEFTVGPGGVTHSTEAINGPSVVLRGRGRYATIIHAPAAGGPALSFISTVDDGKHFQKGLWIEHLAIEAGSPADLELAPGVEVAQYGIHIRGVWQAFFSDVRVEGLTGTGITIESRLGDHDAPVNVTLDNCYLWGNGWGLVATCAPGTGSISYLALRSCSIQGNVLGGIYYTGSIASIRDTGIATNTGAGGLVVGYADATVQGLEVSSSSFENNAPRHIDMRSMMNAVFTNVDFRHTVQLPDAEATEGVRIQPAAGTVAFNIEFQAPFIRINPSFDYGTYRFLNLDGTNTVVNPDGTTIISEVRGVRFSSPRWDLYGGIPLPSETRARIAGNVNDVHLVAPETQGLLPIHLHPGPTPNADVVLDDECEVFLLIGPDTPSQLSGLQCLQYEGRRVVLRFSHGGGDLVLLSDDGGSAHDNQLRLPGGAPITITHDRIVVALRWTAGFGRGWLLESLTPGPSYFPLK